MFRVLADEKINIEAITTSEIKVSALVTRDKALAALAGRPQRVRARQAAARPRGLRRDAGPRQSADAVDIVARLQRMEDLTIDSVSLDESQAQVTLFDVPDQPGIAATSSRPSPPKASWST